MKPRLDPWASRDRDGHPQREHENRTSRNDLRLAAEHVPADGRHATARMLRLLVLLALLATAGQSMADAAERYGHLDSLSMRAEQLRQVSENVEYGEGPEKLGADEPFGPNARKHPMKGEIVRQYEAKAFPGRFYYATYPLPRELTRGKSTVPLRLLYKGPKPGVDVYPIGRMSGRCAFVAAEVE